MCREWAKGQHSVVTRAIPKQGIAKQTQREICAKKETLSRILQPGGERKEGITKFPVMIVMEEAVQEYIGDGRNEMDKVYREHLPEYSRDNQTLLVESSFSGSMTIQQIIKQYLSEQKSKIELDGFTKKSYNKSDNMAVVASTKEDSK